MDVRIEEGAQRPWRHGAVLLERGLIDVNGPLLAAGVFAGGADALEDFGICRFKKRATRQAGLLRVERTPAVIRVDSSKRMRHATNVSKEKWPTRMTKVIRFGKA
jgi:hypothetical protein